MFQPVKMRQENLIHPLRHFCAKGIQSKQQELANVDSVCTAIVY